MKQIGVRVGLAFAVLALSIAAVVVAAGHADVVDVGESFTAHNLACRLLDEDVWVEDGIRHVRGRVSASVVLSESPSHAGTGTLVANADVDTETGHGTFHGALEIRPIAFDGYWAGQWAVVVDADGSRGQAVLLGHGPDLEGLYVVSDLVFLPPDVRAEFASACGGDVPFAGTRAVATVHRLMPNGD